MKNALETMVNISNTNLLLSNLKWCLVNDKKLPYKIDGMLARPNKVEDFVSFETLIECQNIEDYAGLGISIQASQICAIDIDHCFENAFDINSINFVGKDILQKFENFAYCEFSFSGTGMRILFKTNLIDNYSNKYYIKNSQQSIEYYEPSGSFRYVTITGKSIANNLICQLSNEQLTIFYDFLDTYMKRPERKIIPISDIEKKTLEQCRKLIKYLYRKNDMFQSLWFDKAPGSGSNESERDYHLLAYLYEEVTRDEEQLKILFEESPFFKSKDWKHINKWENQDYRYFKYILSQIEKNHKKKVSKTSLLYGKCVI